MYAVIRTGGKQYRLSQGDLFEIEKLDGAVGDQVVFDEVLLLADDAEPVVGSPTIDGARVLGTIVSQGKGEKVVVFKFKRRKMYRRKTGHRQLLTQVKVDAIEGGGLGEKKSASKSIEGDGAVKAKAETARKKSSSKSSSKSERGEDSAAAE